MEIPSSGSTEPNGGYPPVPNGYPLGRNPASWWPIAVLAMSTGFHGKLALRRLQKLRQHRRQHRPKKENQRRENPGSYQSRQEGRWKDLKEDAKTLANEKDALEEDCFSQKHLRCLGSRLVALAAGERD